MFWSGNFIVVRELNFLLKEENVTLTQVLEADDILQECKADNKALMQFLTRPDILAELITLITEEPSKSVELSQQYRHANIACEVLTSSLSMLSDRLSLDVTQMNRLCDFVSRDPPLNPLLASYFSKTVEMLLERSPKQDWYLYHIVCLRVLDFFKSRRDLLPNLLRHMATSAVADTFKFFIRLDDLFNKIIMEWLDEHQFLESVVGIICGTYSAEEAAGAEPEKGQHEPAEKEPPRDGGDAAPAEVSAENQNNGNTAGPAEAETAAAAAGARRARAAAVAAGNAAGLLCDLVATGCAAEGSATRSRTSWTLVSRLQSEAGARGVLASMFTSCSRARGPALVHGCELLLTLLHHPQGAESAERSAVEPAVAPHLPLLHQALLLPPARYTHEDGAADAADTAVGSARLQVAALLAHLAGSSVQEVASTMLTLGTAGVLIDMFFRYDNNNFLHAHVANFCCNALRNPAYSEIYTNHLVVECDLLTRLMDAFDDNENRQGTPPRAGYMGRVVQLLGVLSAHLETKDWPLPDPQRWEAFQDDKLQPYLLCRDTPLGGTYPSDNLYEADNITDALAANYDFSYAMATASMDEVGDDLANDNELGGTAGHPDSADFIADGLGIDDDDDKPLSTAAMNSFLERANERFKPMTDDAWDDAPEPDEEAPAPVLGEASPWECAGAGSGSAEGWAQFSEEEPLAAGFHYWYPQAHNTEESPELCGGMSELQMSGGTALASNLLTAMSAMTPDAIANIVNANLHPLPISDCLNDGLDNKAELQDNDKVELAQDKDYVQPDIDHKDSDSSVRDTSVLEGSESQPTEKIQSAQPTEKMLTEPQIDTVQSTDNVQPIEKVDTPSAKISEPVVTSTDPEKVSPSVITQTDTQPSNKGNAIKSTNINAVSETLPSDVKLPSAPSVISVVVGDTSEKGLESSQDKSQKESLPVDVSESSNSQEMASKSPESKEANEVPCIPEVSEATSVPEISEVTNASEVSEDTSVPEVSEVSNVAEVSEVTGVTEVDDSSER